MIPPSEVIDATSRLKARREDRVREDNGGGAGDDDGGDGPR